MILPRVTGTLQKMRNGHAIVTVHCPECGGTHRHDLGLFDDPEVKAIIAHRSLDAWMACRLDLPGNYYRIVLSPPNKPKTSGDESNSPPAANQEALARPRKRRRRRRKPTKTEPED